MDKLIELLDAYENTGDISIFLRPDVVLDQKKISSHLQSLDPAKREEMERRLATIETALSTFISELAQEKDAVKEQIDRNVKTVQACLSYGQTQGIEDRKKR